MSWNNVSVVEIEAGQGKVPEQEPTTDYILRGALEKPWNGFRTVLGHMGDTDDVYYAGVGPLVYLPEVCRGIGDAPGSCDSLCGNASTMFESWATTWNCLTLATAWQATKVFTNDSSRELARKIEDTISESAAFNVSAFNGMAVFKNAYRCAEASCRYDGGDCTFSFQSAEDFLAGEYLEGASFLNGSFCDGVLGRANPDIAGPGVSRSYSLPCLPLPIHLIVTWRIPGV